MALKAENLVPLKLPHTPAPSSAPEQSLSSCLASSNVPLLVDPEDLVAQAAIEESFCSGTAASDSWQSERDVNSQLSDALLRSRMEQALCVVLLKFTRSPRVFREALMECAELADARHELEASGFASELASGAKIFVQPDHYEAVLEAIRLGSWSLYPEHVIVEPHQEDMVVQLVRKLHGKYKVYPKSSSLVPLGLSQTALESPHSIQVSRTFINISVPSSLYSSSRDGCGQRT